MNVDLGDGALYTGEGDAPDTGTVWNAFTSAGGTTALLDSTGAASGITFTMGATVALTNSSASPLNDLTVDGLWNSGSPLASFSIDGLLPSTQYDFYSVGGGTGWFHFQTPIISGPVSTGGTLGSVVTRLESDATGAISGTFGGNFADLPDPGFQLSSVPVPEPSPLALAWLALAGLGVALRRR